MSGIQQLLLGGSPAGYQIERSLRFNSADSAYLNRTPASAGNRTTWTWSCWLKRSNLGSLQGIFTSGNDAISARGLLEFEAADTIRFGFNDGTTWYLASTVAVFRDPSAFYHIVIALDLSNGTNANRVKLYINNVQQTFASTPTWPTSNQVFNNNVIHRIGAYYGSPPAYYLNGYLTEVNFIDGQALTPSSFGQTNASTGVWEPVKYTGTYGTNGFYLNFSDNSNTTAATLGKDYSGNGNNWTPNNFSVTAGAGNDSLVDTPTSYGTDTGVGGEVRGNYATLNPLDQSSVTVSNGNLSQTTASGRIRGTFFLSSGKWYCEVTFSAIPSTTSVGIANTSYKINTSNDTQSRGYLSTGSKITNGTSSAYGASYTSGDVIGVAFDIDAGTITFYKNNVSQGVAFTDIANDSWSLWIQGGYTGDVNFGQRPFAYTAPSGFKALCTQNLPTPTIGATSTTQANRYFDIQLYTGTGSSRSVTGYNFQPEFVWIKGRSGATDHGLYDAVRGVQLDLVSNSTAAETTQSTGLTAFNSDGFTVGSLAKLNTNTATYVAWAWDAADSNSTNTSGTITSTVRANTTAGFSIVTYSGTSVVGTIGHGLGVAPKMIIVKCRNTAATDWATYHTSIGATAVIALNSTGAPITIAGSWNNTAPTSSVFTVGTGSGSGDTNFSGRTYVAYCWAEIDGFSKFGSYTGNGSSDGPFVFTGMRPRYILIKRTTNADNWFIFDTARIPSNVATVLLYANLSNAEATFTSLDILSNGFKIRTSDAGFNASANDYIYAAFAESPFKFSLAR